MSAGFRAAHPQIPWQDAADMRNRLVHGYYDIDLDVVWSTAKLDVPALILLLETLIASTSPED
ncbi:MAG: HepT-like ribonuclease domain-containing protein [Longimicrobiaceae bacterium]